MKSKYWLLIFISFLVFSCSRDNSSENSAPLVAKVGPEKISLQDLEISFLMDPQYTVRTPLRQARRSQLNYLITEKQALLAAQEINLQADPAVLRKTEYIRKQEIIKAFLQQKFLDKITVTDTDIQEGLCRAAEQIRVQNIFCSEAAAAEKIRQEITAENDAQQIFERRGVELGWISFGNLDRTIEDSIYNSTPGKIIGPVRSAYGYHVLKADSVRTNYAFEMLNPSLQLQQITDIIRRRKADYEIRSYLSQLAGDRQIQTANRSLEKLSESFKDLAPNASPDPLTLAPPLQNRDLLDVRLKLSDLLNEALLKFGTEQWTIGDFLERVQEMPPYHRPYLQGRNRITQAMIDLVRDDLILQQAGTENFSQKKEVRKTYQKQIGEFLAREFNQRYNDTEFRQTRPQEWARYEQALLKVRREYKPSIYEKNLFGDVQNPDSIMTSAPLPVFFKNRYIW